MLFGKTPKNNIAQNGSQNFSESTDINFQQLQVKTQNTFDGFSYRKQIDRQKLGKPKSHNSKEKKKEEENTS